MYSIYALCRRHSLLLALFILTLVSYLYLNFVTITTTPVFTSEMKIYRPYSSYYGNHHCVEQKNFVFIKQMKCATSTLVGTFYRFGYKRNLSFVSPVEHKIYLNWPYPMTKLDFRPSSSGFNILADHSIYTEDVMKSIMPADTVYLSIIRHPFAHVKSVFQYFKLDRVSDVPRYAVNPFEEYLRDIDKYEDKYKSAGAKSRTCIPGNFSMTKNLMSHCLGIPLGFPPGTPDISTNVGQIDEYIDRIDKKFTLVMIVEYFLESLILLRRLMCWKLEDLLFLKANVAKYSFDKDNISGHFINVHKNWSSIDYRLFRHFNKTLWIKISEQSSDFFEEVAAFKVTQEKVEKYCRLIYRYGERPFYRYPDGAQRLIINATVWNSEFTVSTDDCWMLGPDPYRLFRAVQRENDFKERARLNKQSKVLDHRKLKGLC